MQKNIKLTLLSGSLLSLIVSIGCIPQAFQGLPDLVGQTASPNPRTDLCNLLLSVGRTDADVQTCLTATAISQVDIDRLCALSNNLTAAQKETLRTGLTNLGVDTTNSCPVLSTPAPSATPTGTEQPATSGPTGEPTSAPTAEPTAEPTSEPTVAPTATNEPIPSPTASTGTGGGGTGGGFGGGSSSSGNGLTGTVGANDPEPTDPPLDE